jgi:hypothetical protein
MANVYIKGRSPKGTVGVDGVVDSGELSAYTAGVLSGFGGKSVSSWTIQVGGQTGVQDTAVAKNPSGESELFAGTPGQSIGFTLPGAPGTPGQSQVHALVIYKDPFTVSLVNNAVDVIDYQVVSGTSATTGSQVAPDDAAIRSAIPSGSLKFVTVVGYVTIAYGASSVSLGNLVLNRAVLSSSLIASSPTLGAQKAYVATSESTSSASYAKLTTTTDKVTVNIGVSGMAIIIASAMVSGSGGPLSYFGVGVSGATTRSAATNDGAGLSGKSIPNTVAPQTSIGGIITGLTPGSNTFDLYYASSTGSSTFAYRTLSVIPI